MRQHHELPDRHWERIAPFFPPAGHRPRRGRPLEDHHRILNGILWRLHTGALARHPGSLRPLGNLLRPLPALAPRRHLGENPYLPARRLRAAGPPGPRPLARRCHRGPGQPRRRGGRRPPRRGSAPGRAEERQVEEPEKHALGYSRGGFGTKVHLLVTGRGIVLGIYVTPGQQHESTAFEPLLRRVLLRRRPGMPYWPTKLAGDKGYSYPHIRSWARRHHIEPVIPTRKDQPRQESFDKASYRKRNRIERVIGHYKECRCWALATRNWLWTTSPCGWSR